MSDDRLDELASRALGEIAALEEAADDPDRVRSWARAHFASLVRLQRSAVRAARQVAPQSSEADDLRASLASVVTTHGGESLGAALGALMQLTGAQRGFIAVRDHRGALSFPAARAFESLDIHTPEAMLSSTILRAALDGRATVEVDDVQADLRFAGKTSVQELALRAVLVVPLQDAGVPYGVLYLDTSLGAFRADSRRAGEEFVGLVAPILARDLALSRAEEARDARFEKLRRELRHDGILATSDAMASVLEVLARVARTGVTLLLRGETGTGKELLARAVHASSPRASKPFIAVNCAAIPSELAESEFFGHERGAFTGAAAARDGSFAAAHGGTLFLDEVGELAPDTQAKLLRALNDGSYRRLGSTIERKVDVRVIAATHRDLTADVALGRFREDLLFRLNVIEVTVPALRERRDDVRLLARFFAEHFARAHGVTARAITPRALAALEEYAWPGNVRELRNAIERAVVLAREGDIDLAALAPPIRADATTEEAEGLKAAMRAFKKRYVERAVEANGGDHDATARTLGVHPKYLYRLLRGLDLRDDE